MSIGNAPYLHVNIEILARLAAGTAHYGDKSRVFRAIERKRKAEARRLRRLAEGRA